MMTDAPCSTASEKAGELAPKVAEDPTIGEHLNFTYTNMGYILTPRGNGSEAADTAK